MDVRKGKKVGRANNMNAVAEPAGLFGAMVPVFGVATVGLPAARLRGPKRQR